jgi:hypothetical protein
MRLKELTDWEHDRMAKHRNQAELFLDGQFLVKVLRPF